MRKMQYFRWALVAVAMFMVAACSSGGGDSAKGNSTSSISLLGVVDFPAAAPAKTVAKVVAATDITVDVFDLSGKKIATVNPKYDDAASTRIYSYEVPGLAPGVDYVVKARKGNQTVKKLVEKAKTGSDVAGVNLNAASTTALIVAEQKIMNAFNLAAVKLGEEAALPGGITSDALSQEIAALKPSVLEDNISALASALENGNLASINSGNVALANMYLTVVQLLKSGVDVQDFVSGTSSASVTVQLINVSSGTPVVETKVLTSADAKTSAVSAAASYTPPTDTASAVFFVEQAAKFLDAQDIPNANINYEKALAADSGNTDANLGAAITKGILLIENSDVKAIVERWGAVAPTVNDVISASSPVGNPFGNFSSVLGKAVATTSLAKAAAPAAAAPSKLLLDALKSLKAKLPQQRPAAKSSAKLVALAPANAPSVGEMQAVIENVLTPALQTLGQRLARVQGHGFTFVVTKAMQGNVNGTDIVLDDGEFYALDAAVSAVGGLLKIVTAYNFDVAANDYNAIERDPLATLNNPTFFTLKSNGRAKMADALALVRAARDKTELAYNVVRLRAAGQGAFDLTGVSDVSKSDFEKFIAQAKIVLTGPTMVTIGGIPVTVDATKFFTNPLDRSKAPTFGYDVQPDATLSAVYGKPVAAERTVTGYYWNGTSWVYGPHPAPVESEIVAKSDLPDYTLNGILPENSASSNVAGFNGVLPVLDGKVLTGATRDWYHGLFADGDSIVSIDYDANIGKQRAKRIHPGTGEVSDDAVFETGGKNVVSPLFSYNGAFYCFVTEGISNGVAGSYLSIYRVDRSSDPWTAASTPVWTKNLGTQSLYRTVAASSGTDIYYTSTSWSPAGDQTTVYRISNLSGESVLFTAADYIDSLMYSGGFLYTDGNDFLNKYSVADGTAVSALASTGIHGNVVLLGGQFYSVSEGKLIKSAGTPAGGLAKLSALLGF
ncbi:MAG: hypothetical protein A2075_16015 [Geobacteraceae bacterium GWC2_58_44]|nr:MAG: hypothetical protein A2075_16015 [Geobacteraceae bacterium GWC2_58_44]HBG04180.1 hypothetical protein [Geobacter sp.]